MAAAATAINLSIIPNVTPEELMTKKREAANVALNLALQKNIGTKPSDIAIVDGAPEDLGLSSDDFEWSAPGSTGWSKKVNSVKVENKVIVFYGVKSVDGDPVVGIRFTQGQNKDLQIRGEFNLHTMYHNVDREANAVFPDLIKYTPDEYINIYMRFKSNNDSVLIPLFVVAKPKSQVIG